MCRAKRNQHKSPLRKLRELRDEGATDFSLGTTVRSRCGRSRLRMLADFAGVISHMPVSGQHRVSRVTVATPPDLEKDRKAFYIGFSSCQISILTFGGCQQQGLELGGLAQLRQKRVRHETGLATVARPYGALNHVNRGRPSSAEL
jgi:hypothetical protein